MVGKYLKINDNSFDRLINVDGTSICMEMPVNITIDKKVANNIEINIFGG